MPYREAIVAALLVWAVTIAFIDWRVRKVPNALLLAVLLPAGAICFWRGESVLGVSTLASLLGLLAGLLLTLPGYVFGRQFGAGDVKLAATLGFLVGWRGLLPLLLIAALVLGLMSLITVARLGLKSARKLRLPAAVALSAGFAAVLLLMHLEAP